jgi:hypothetical protein
MNKFVAVGAYTNGKHLYISSNSVHLELLDEVMKIVCRDATYTFFEGELKCVYDYIPEPLLNLVKSRLSSLQKFASANPEVHEEIFKLKDYIGLVEACL